MSKIDPREGIANPAAREWILANHDWIRFQADNYMTKKYGYQLWLDIVINEGIFQLEEYPEDYDREKPFSKDELLQIADYWIYELEAMRFPFTPISKLDRPFKYENC